MTSDEALDLAIGGLSVTTAYGQASTTTFLNKFTFSDGRPNPCNGEFVSFDGTLTSVSHFTNTPNGGTMIFLISNQPVTVKEI